MDIDYHVEVDKVYYSVPYQLVGEVVDVRLTLNTLEILHKGDGSPVTSVHTVRDTPAHSPTTCRQPTGRMRNGHLHV